MVFYNAVLDYQLFSDGAAHAAFGLVPSYHEKEFKNYLDRRGGGHHDCHDSVEYSFIQAADDYLSEIVELLKMGGQCTDKSLAFSRAFG